MGFGTTSEHYSSFLLSSNKASFHHNTTGYNTPSSFSTAPESLASLEPACPDFLSAEAANEIPPEILDLDSLMPYESVAYPLNDPTTYEYSSFGVTSPNSSQDQDQDQEDTSPSSSVTPDRQPHLHQQQQTEPRCWDHGCNGRLFSSKSNLMRHRKERSSSAAGNTTNKATCPLCGAIFTRNSARDTHLARQSCARIRRYSNGRLRPSRLAMLGNPQLAVASGLGDDVIRGGGAEDGGWGDLGSMGWN